MKKFLALIMVALLIFCMASCSKKDAEGDDADNDAPLATDKSVVQTDKGTFEYGINEAGEYEIIKYSPKSVAVVDLELPKATDDGRDIVGIAKEAFKADSTIKSVVIPETYTYIGKHAFYDCDGLVSVSMANSVTTIYEGAFQKCDKLATVTLSTALKELSAYAFAGCVSLTEANLSGDTAIIGDGAFLGCSELTKVTLSDKLASVTKTAFLECPKLTYTEYGNAKYLGNEANPHLALIRATDLNIESCGVNDATRIIATSALANCEALKSVKLGAALKYVNGDCFTNSPWIEYTEYENARYLGTSANPYMVVISVIIPSAEALTLHADTAIITDSAFANCPELADISYSKTAADWDKIVKTSNWNHDMSIIVHCSDKNIEN